MTPLSSEFLALWPDWQAKRLLPGGSLWDTGDGRGVPAILVEGMQIIEREVAALRKEDPASGMPTEGES